MRYDTFWESEQRARKGHFCHRCNNYIHPGELYRRQIWAPKAGSFHVMKEHVEPECPPDVGEELAMEAIAQERAALGIPIAFEIKVEQVLVMLADGSAAIEERSVLVPTAATAGAKVVVSFDPDEIIPF